MCGIVGYAGNSNATAFLTQGLCRLEYRGYDSAGIAVLDGEIKAEKTTNRITALEKKASYLTGFVGIGHTRWATHGAATAVNAHPHLSNDGNFAVVHNGIIENYAELKAELITDGFRFVSDTDTEVIPMLFQKYYKGDSKATVFEVLSRLKGSYALAILCKDLPGTVIAAKSFSPLLVGIGSGENYIASDICALNGKTDKVIYLSDGEVCFASAQKITLYGADGSEKTPEITLIGETETQADKGEFPHYMIKEITEQPRVFKETIEHYLKDGEVSFSGALPDIKSFDKIDIVACGSAFYAGMVAKYAFEELLGVQTNVEIASEYRYRRTAGGDKCLAIAISQSGETADTISAISKARAENCRTLSIVNVKQSTLSRICDSTIYTLAGPEIAVATTKGYLTQLAIIYLMAVCWAKMLNKSEKTAEKILCELKILPEKISRILKEPHKIQETAKLISESNSVFFIGRNTDYAVSLEAGLKLKEISYIHAESYPAGELKHGTISLITEGTPVIALCANKALRHKSLSNIKEVSARGGYIIACSTENDCEIEKYADTVFLIPETEDLLSPVTEVIPFQLLAYYTALYKGCDIDKPRNLAKSVTVE